ncbi:hypothetical protein DFQ27_002297 [Actinomortierella ambigua]|uniref:CUE domain-containing protein n=1 Tax=Actinomortierella ambigua TaxID=1343610 RepID=A0A9P6U7J2_9FUNG|nr:hypothetical protein DFQ27_002297 [Actinomortierella ambigua]
MSNHPPLELLPFVTPATDQTLTELDFSIAVDDWNDSLSRILRYNVAAFWKELAINDTLPTFLNTFLGEYAQFKGDRHDNWVLEASEVVRRVLFIYKRVAETISSEAVQEAMLNLPAASSASDPASILLDRGIVSTPVLLDLASIYGRSDPDMVAFVVNAFLEQIPWLVDDFGASAKTVMQIIRRVQRKFEKGVRSGQGKGKGKGKSVSSGQDDSALYHNLSHEEVQEALQVSHMLHNIVLALDSITGASPRLGVELEKQDSFLQCLSGCYNYTLPVLWKVLTENPAGHEPRTVALLQNLRVRTLSIVSNILDDIYKTVRLGPEPSSDENKAMLTDRVCGIIMDIFDQSPVSDTAVPMVDAPLIVDLELQFEVAQKLKNMIVEMFEGNNDRLHNMVVMLESLRNLNNATISYAEDLSLRKTERLARKLNNIYLNESRENSASTISSTPIVQHQHQHHHPADSEEDYVKRTMLISQLQDLFPDLGDGFLEACLKAFNDDPEAVTMHLLEESLPVDLVLMDRSTPRASFTSVAPMPTMALVPVSVTPAEPANLLSTRRNIFDGDEFDVFAGKDVNRSLMSRKKAVTEADHMLEDKSFVVEHKNAIIQAVENMYDDEYDDTYDSMGINNAGADYRLVDDIDLASDEPNGRQQPGTAPMRLVDPSVEHEEVLINLFTGDKDIFNRTREARKSKKRQELRQLTKMTDEQLEGWAIMFNRNPRKEDLTRKYEFANTFGGNERTLERTEFGTDKRKGGRLPPLEKSQQTSSQQGGQRQGRSSPAPRDGATREGRASPRPSGQGAGSSAGSGAGAGKKHGQPGQQGQQGQQQRQPKQQQQQPRADQADAKSSSSNNNNNNKNNNNPSSSGDRAKNERNKASKANHNRRNAHAKKMASLHP